MTHTSLITLLIPLIMLFSISVKAVDSNERSLLKGGVLESVYEVPDAEVAPDIEHTLLPVAQNGSLKFNHSKSNSSEGFHTSKVVLSWCCRGPPQA